MEYILRLPSWQEKQDAVDELFESIEFQLKDEEEILSKHPKFSFWVERAVEEFLEECQTQEQAKRDGSSIATGDERVNFESTDPTSSGELNVSETNSTDSEGIIELPGISVDENIATPPEPEERRAYPTFKEDAESLPIFMDVYQGEEATQAVPPILYPLKPNPHEKAGRMVEEWELSPHKTSKRIMLRQCMRKISRALEENESVRVFVSGRKGVGKVCLQVECCSLTESFFTFTFHLIASFSFRLRRWLPLLHRQGSLAISSCTFPTANVCPSERLTSNRIGDLRVCTMYHFSRKSCVKCF
jgi:hypothetical protein